MTQCAFYLDMSRCTGCKTCQMACKDYKDLDTDVTYRRVYDYEGGKIEANPDGTVSHNVFMYHVSLGCNHCEHPACTEVCPTLAMHKDSETGLVSVDESKCMGCGYCVIACPYNVPVLKREIGHTVKCNGCEERIKEGKQPICVEACPLRALEFKESSEAAAKGKRADVAPLPDPSLTTPSLYLKPCVDAKPFSECTGIISNYLEVK